MTNKMTKRVESQGKNSLRKGFTLVELLGVIAIIVVLSSLSIGGVMSVMNKAKIRDSQQLANQLKVAIENYHAEYGRYPLPDTPSGGGTWADNSYISTNASTNVHPRFFLGELYGEYDDEDASTVTINYKKRKFLFAKDAQNSDDLDNAKGGVVWLNNGEIRSLKDSWGKQFVVRMDLNFDGKVELPTIYEANPGTKEYITGKVIVYSHGADLLPGTDDDILSWKDTR